MLTDEEIIQLASEHGFSLYLHGSLQPVDNGDGTISLKKSKDLTAFARKLITFARAIEDCHAN